MAERTIATERAAASAPMPLRGDKYPRHIAVDFKQLRVRCQQRSRHRRGQVPCDRNLTAYSPSPFHTAPLRPQLNTLKRYIRNHEMSIRPDSSATDYAVACAV